MESGKEPGTLSEVVAELRKLWPQTDWAKCDDPLAELHALRCGPAQNHEAIVATGLVAENHAEALECAARLCEEMADEPDEPVSYESAVRCEALREAARRIRGLKDIPF